ncbi:hypothetical protein mru_1972 [Methanobrevibacter ruminantium M1]|uniref:Uncharacterized protein n=1 Tax=Methanobrevibacter ruminantium (strain ATCC 35063 / DSM 1093 / JCM 13430 / OCM 146 / M1) TaxID=634498 RepID=D3E098_METRM|nr:hypothetical protein [Methanobrevibacter ruminantium]ADC47822.1 hypothetical protein mru_1972 [Methanobrevibacter ruminantium M1]
MELVIFKAENKLEEIFLNAQLKMQKAKNELIKNMEKDIEKAIELAAIEVETQIIKENIDIAVDALEETIEEEKADLAERFE